MKEPSVHRHATLDGVRLHYVEVGKGPLVILLHGFPECWYAWRFQIPVLAAAGFRVIAVDLRGYSTSDKPEGVRHYEWPALVGDVRQLIRHAGAARAIVAGHDWGGVIAWWLAMRHPEAVDRLIVLNAPHPARFLEELRDPRQWLRSWYILGFQLPWLPELIIRSSGYAWLRRILASGTARPGAFDATALRIYQDALAQKGALTAAIHYYRANVRLGQGKIRAALTPIQTPTLLIWGARDRYLGPRLAEGLDPWVPHLTREIIPEASHWVQADEPERVNASILRFLRSCGSRES